MNWVDYAIIAIILLSTFASLWRGLVRELLSLLIWVAAVLVGWIFHPQLALHLDFIESLGLRHLAAFILLFLVVMIIGAVIGYLISVLLERAGISGTDRMLGGIFGAVRGAALVVILVLVAGALPLNDNAWWLESAMLGHFADAALWLRDQLPGNFAEHFPHLP